MTLTPSPMMIPSSRCTVIQSAALHLHDLYLPLSASVYYGHFTVSTNIWSCDESLAVDRVLVLMAPKAFTVGKDSGALLDKMAQQLGQKAIVHQ